MMAVTNSGKPPQGVAENTRRTTVNSTMITVPGSRAVNWAYMLIFAKSKLLKNVGKVGIAPGLFNINEPVTFGLPIVLNPILMIPYILSPMAAMSVQYLGTDQERQEPPAPHPGGRFRGFNTQKSHGYLLKIAAHSLLLCVRSALKMLALYLFQGFPFLICCLTIFTNGECRTGFDMAVKSVTVPRAGGPSQRPGRRSGCAGAPPFGSRCRRPW